MEIVPYENLHTIEQWKPIIINETRFNYLISNLGNVWSEFKSMLLNPFMCSGYKTVILYNNENR